MNHENIELAPNARWVHEKSAEVKIKQINGHNDSIINCQLFKSNENIFTVSNDNTARIWDFVTGRELHVYGDLHEEKQPITRGKLSDDNTK